MAQFDDKNLRLPQPSSYLGMSQGTSAARPNEALGTLFKGLGNVIDAGVTTADEANKTAIEQQLTEGVDAIRGAQGVDAAVAGTNSVTQLLPDTSNTPSGGGVKAPAAVENATSEIARLNAAYQDGKIGDSQYWAKTEALVRQVRARYPGYREEIDKKVASITGTTPANALRRSLLEDLETQQRKQASAVDKFDTFVRSNLENVSPETRQKWINGERGSTFQAQVYDEVGKNQVQVAEVTRERARIGLAKERGDLQQDDALGVATSEVNQFVNRSIDSGVSAAGGNELMTRIQNIVKSGRAPTPEEITQIRGQFAVVRSQIASGVDKILTNPLRPGSADSYSSIIRDPTKLKQAKELAMSQINNMEQLLIDGNFGLFAVNANAAKASQDATTRKVLESNEFARKLQAARTILGDAGMGVWLSTPGGMQGLNEISKALNDLSLTENVTGTGDPLAQLKRMKEQSVKDPKVYKNYLDTNSRVLGAKETPTEAVANLGKSFFSEGGTGFISQFQEGQRAKVFSTLTTPEITANMVKVKGTNPEVWNQYKDWAGRNFYAINKQTIDNVVAFAKNDMGANVAVDESGRLRVVDFNPGGFRPDLMPGDSMIRGPRIQQLQAQLDTFNRGLDALDPIYKADGLKLKDALGVVYRQMGLAVEANPPGSSEDKESGNGDSPRSNQQSSLGNQVQLAAFTPEDNTVTGLRDSALIDLEAEIPASIDLEGPVAAGLTSGRYSPILNLIGRAEAPRGYNQIFGRGREAPLTQMTVSEVYDLQRRMVNSGSESSAVGKYQFLRKTLEGAVRAAGLDPETTKMTPEVQDRLATILLQRRGLNKYLSGSISQEEFADNLAKEWAGLPVRSGKSFYAGVGSNNATVNRQNVIDALDQLSISR